MLASTPSHGTASFPITAKSSLPPVTGHVFVVYQGGTDASARVQGEIKGATSGEIAQLYAQQFPYQSAPAPAGSIILHPTGTTTRYAFQVTPALATRYKVALFRNSTATIPIAISATSTIYVTTTGTSGNTQTCGRPVCHEIFRMRILVPAPALKTEISKPWYPYSQGLRQSRSAVNHLLSVGWARRQGGSGSGRRGGTFSRWPV